MEKPMDEKPHTNHERRAREGPADATGGADREGTPEASSHEELLLQAPPVLSHEGEMLIGLPDSLKAGIEALSGLSMDDVTVHYNSPRPVEVQALAYAQGSEIYLGPGQEQHLAHEAWHVVQQKQRRVKPSLQAKGMAINDDPGLEQEADLVGKRARTLGDWLMRTGKADPTMFLRRANWILPSEELHPEILGEVIQCVQGPDEQPWSSAESEREKKKKARQSLSPSEKEEKAKDKRARAFLAAEACLYEYKPKSGTSTYCVFLDDSFKPVSYGESGWDKAKYDPQLLNAVLGQAKSVKAESIGQVVGYGTSCAEPQALVEAAKKKLDHAVKYSLAWDQNSEWYKDACGTCKILLKSNGIDDLYDVAKVYYGY